MTGDDAVREVRGARRDDLEALLRLQQVVPEAPQWSEAIWRAMLEDAETSLSRRWIFVLEHEGALLGYLVLHRVADVAELESVAVETTARRQGIARALCRAAWQAAREEQVREVQLEVRASNGAARSLYRSLGFVEQGLRAGYYESPREDAVLLSLTGGDGAASRSG